MPRMYDIRELVGYIRSTRQYTFKAMQLAMLEATLDAEAQAKLNASKIFTGTEYRPKTGNLVNAIFSAFNIDFLQKQVVGIVGVRANKGRAGTRPYGRAHEFGAVIEPVNAKWLWIPIRNAQTRAWENLSPGDFVKEMQRPSSEYKIIRGRQSNTMVAVYQQAAKVNKTKSTRDLIVLFALKKKVELPKRPFVTPAVEQASKTFPALFAKRLAEVVNE